MTDLLIVDGPTNIVGPSQTVGRMSFLITRPKQRQQTEQDHFQQQQQYHFQQQQQQQQQKSSNESSFPR